MSDNKSRIVEFGDFQTPDVLAQEVATLLVDLGIKPKSVIEPTCGKGSFLIAALEKIKSASHLLGADINQAYLEILRRRIQCDSTKKSVNLVHSDFFSTTWEGFLKNLPEPILILGNPPWVTNSALGALNGSNLPEKVNEKNENGLGALTGKSNFDISEWMVLKYLDWLKRRSGTIAVLCKFSVAKKVMESAWRRDLQASIRVYKIDAQLHFNVSVDACLLIIDFSGAFDRSISHKQCPLFHGFGSKQPSACIGFEDNTLLSDSSAYRRWRILRGSNSNYEWRSGVKHDCSKIMELEKKSDGSFLNGLGEKYFLEDEYIYPLLKSSDLGNRRLENIRKHVVITQKQIGGDTSSIKKRAPLTWSYLETHEELFLQRKSSIYKNKPPYSIFGVGEYSFAPWKIAISGFYKKMNFSLVGPVDARPVMFDDTIVFIPCWSEDEGEFLLEILNSEPSKTFLESMIFWEDKRPITVELLKRLDVCKLSQELGLEIQYGNLTRKRPVNLDLFRGQLSLLAGQRHELAL